jgi:YidC/Oxa1 family membrane protein insertase
MDSRLRFVLIAVAVGLALYFFVFRRSNSTPPPPVVEAPLPTAVQRGPERVVWLQSGPLTAAVSTYSGAVEHLYLNNNQFRGQEISTTHEEPSLPLRSTVSLERNGTNVMPPYLTFQVEEATPTSVRMVARPEGTNVVVERIIQAHTAYSFQVLTRVTNAGDTGRVAFSEGVSHWVRRSEESGGLFRQSWRLSEGLCGHDGGRLFRESRDDIGKRGAHDGIASSADFVGVGNLYFLSALVPIGSERAACHLRVEDRSMSPTSEPSGSLIHARLSWRPAPLGHGESHDYVTVAYFGPKLTSTLIAAAPPLRETVNLGFFAIIARLLLRLLQFLNGIVHNWGIAIILLTVIVRVALFPILARSTKSMAMMQKLKPELDGINAKYKDDAEQRGLATMELYRKHKVNPLGGCLPQLAQLPVWWALYTTLQTSVELFHSPFYFWVHDLSAPDKFFILPLVLGAVMFLQQRLMPPAMPDPTQAKIMLYFMPIFLTGISLFLPAGLALYMLVNSVLAIVQQKITKAQIDRMVAAASSGEAIVVRPADPEPRDPLPSGRGNGGGRRGGKRR